MKFSSYLLKKKQPIQKIIDRSLSVWQKKLLDQTSALKDLTHLLLESNHGGKHIRGALVCLGYDLFASSKLADLYKIAAAYEILHTSLLIHDDVMDKSLTRRGKQTLYQQLGGKHYGISQAISLGDVGFFLATQVINETKIDDNIKFTIVAQFSQIVLNTITGQMLDMKFAKMKEPITEKDVLAIYRLKTAQYTIAGPLIIGALLAERNKKVITKLTHFGEALGIAFQIKDDILGIFGDETAIGKSITSDIEEGKNTLLLVHALENASRKQKDLLIKYYGNGKITIKEILLMRQILEETGALSYAERTIQAYSKEAMKLVPQITKKKTMQTVLNDLITYLIERDK